MIIGIDASSAAKKEKTGIDNTAYQIILNLQKIDKSNTYYLYTNKELPKEIKKQKNVVERLIPLQRLWHKLRLPLALLRDKPDCFLELTSGIPSIYPSKSFVLIHDLAFKYFPDAYSKSELLMQEQALNSSIRRARKLIVTTNSTRNDLAKFCQVDPSQVEVVPLGFDSSQYKPLNNPINPLKISEPFFLYVGRLEKRKNVKNIIRAFNLFKDKISSEYKLILVGSKGYGFQEIRQEIESSKYRDDIIETGYLNNSSLSRLMNLATCLLYPSLYEGFGLPILEAFSCKTPVIVSDIKTLREVAQSAALIVRPDSPNDIASKMISLIEDKSLRSKLIRSGTSRLKKFSWLDTSTKILKIITNE